MNEMIHIHIHIHKLSEFTVYNLDNFMMNIIYAYKNFLYLNFKMIFFFLKPKQTRLKTLRKG